MSTIEFSTKLYSLSDTLHAFAYSLTKNKDDAMDLYQETAFKVIKNKDKFRIGTNFKAWVMVIMRNTFISDYRKKSNKRTIQDTTDNLYYLNSGSTINNNAESNIMMGELNVMIESLEPNLREPFEMHFAGYKYQEIAEHLEVPLGTVKARIFFARRDLKAMVQCRYHGMRA